VLDIVDQGFTHRMRLPSHFASSGHYYSRQRYPIVNPKDISLKAKAEKYAKIIANKMLAQRRKT